LINLVTKVEKTVDKYVFLVEGDHSLRSDLERALNFSGYTVQSFPDAEQFLLNFKPVAPAVLVTDMRMPKRSGIQLQMDLMSGGHKIPVIFIGGDCSNVEIVESFKNGAFDFLFKPFDREEFLGAVAKAIQKETVAMQDQVSRARLAERLKTLSPRQREVFDLLSLGFNNKEITEKLRISLATAKEYKSEVMYKLSLRSLSELIALHARISDSKNTLTETH